MADDGTEQITHYTGTFAHGVDAAWRVQIPSEWRQKPEVKKEKSGDEAAKTPAVKVYLRLKEHAAAGKHVQVLSEREVQQINARFERELEREPEREEEIADLRREAFQGMQPVTLDSVGRVSLSEVTAEAAGLKAGKPATLVGVGRYFEIWNSSQFALAKAASEQAAAERRALNVKQAARKRADEMKRLES